MGRGVRMPQRIGGSAPTIGYLDPQAGRTGGLSMDNGARVEGLGVTALIDAYKRNAGSYTEYLTGL